MLEAIKIKTSDGFCDTRIAKPEGPGPWPAIIFCMDAVGPRENLERMAERLAAHGFYVLLPNIFYRRKQAPIVEEVSFPARIEDLPKILEQIMPLVETFKTEDALKDMKECIGFLKRQPDVSEKRFGIFGYCMGGALAIRTAATFPEEFAAIASFHAGSLVTEDVNSPHKILSKLRGAVYVGHADHDPYMSSEQIAVFDEAAAAILVPHETELYLGAHHHFTMADLPAYSEKAAEKHWEKLT